MHHFTKFFLLVGLAFLCGQKANAQCKSNWLYGRTVTIDNTASNNAQDSTAKRLVINTSSLISASKMQASGADIRFITKSCDDLHHWLESGINTSKTVIWVRVPNIASKDSVQIEMLYGNSAVSSTSKFNRVFPKQLKITSSTTISGYLNYDYLEVATGVTVTLSPDSILDMSAAYIVLNGNINGEGKGYIAPTSCVDGRGPGGSPKAPSCNNGGGGGYGGQGGCSPTSGANTCNGARSSTYGTLSGFEIDKGSSGSIQGGSSPNRAGDGGGGLKITCEQIEINGFINLNGEDGLASTTGSFGGGGGSGGGLRIMTRYIQHNTSTISADGGIAGNSFGGSGGGGRIKIFFEEATSGSTSISVEGINDHGQTGTPITLKLTTAVGLDGTIHNAKTSLNDLTDILWRGEEKRASINTSAITGTNFCSNDKVNVNFTITGVFSSSNVFSVQLSDASGSFSSPTTIGSVTSATPKTISATIPGTVTAGTKYRLRVVASNPAIEGSDNGSNFTLNAGIVPDFSFSRVCEGNATVFIDVSTIQSGTITSLAYDFDNDGIFDKTGLTAGSSTTNTYGSEGTYTTVLEVTGSNGCKVKDSRTVTVDDLPSVAFSADAVCIGDSTSFSDLSTISIGSITSVDVDFETDGVYDKTGLTPGVAFKHKYATAGTKNVTFRINTNRGCNKTLTKQVFVDPYPSPDFDLTGATCIKDTVTFTDKSTATPGVIDYVDYDFDADGVYDLTNQSPGSSFKKVFDTLVSSFVVIRATTLRGCVNTTAKTVNIYDKAVGDFITLKECKNTPVKFTDKSAIGVGTIQKIDFDFDSDGTYDKTGLLAGGSAEHTYTTDGLKSVRMRVTSDKGCITIKDKNLFINPDPVPHFIASEECAGDATIFQDSSSVSTGSISSVDFDFDNDGIFDRTGLGQGAYVSYTYPAAGPKDVTIRATTAAGCQVSATKAFSIFKAVSVNPNPLGAFTNDIVCFGDSTKFTDKSSVTSGSIVQLQYDFDNDGVYDTTLNKAGDVVYGTLPLEGNNKINILTLSDKGCLSLASQTVKVNAAPVPTFTVDGQCEGQVTEFVNSTSLSFGSIVTVDYDFDNDGIYDRTGVKAVDTVSYQYNSFGIKTIIMRAISSEGCVSTATRKLNYSPLPDVGFDFSNNCLGKESLFDNTSSITAGTLANFYWSLGDGGDSRIKNATNIYDKEGVYSVELIVESDNQCFDTIRKNITVYAQPKADFDFSNVCAGESVNFKSTSTISSGALANVWDLGNGQNSISANPVGSYRNDGRYLVELVVSSANGCKDSISQSLEIYEKPTALFTQSDVCDGFEAQFKNQTTGASAYAWTFGDGSSSSVAQPSRTYTSDGSYTVQLIATSSKSCKDTFTVSQAVFANPTADFAVTNACFGKEHTLTNSSTGSSSYTWSFGDGTISTTKTPTKKYSLSGTYSIQLIARSTKGCGDTLAKSVTVYDLPSFKLTSTDECRYDSLTFAASGTGLQSVRWDFGDGSSLATRKKPKHQYATAGTYSVGFQATTVQGCIDSSRLSVEAFAVPTASFSSSNECLQDQSSFVNKSSLSAGTYRSSWDFGDSKGTSTAENPSYTYSSAGTYNVELTVESNNGCTGKAVNSTTIYSLPSASFTMANICPDDALKPTNTSTGASSYTWSFGDGKTSTATSPSHYYSGAGYYTVSLATETSDGCKDSEQKSLQVYAKPNASYNVSNNCLNEPTQYTNLSTGATVYAWQMGDGTGTSIDKNPIYLYKTSGSFSSQLIVTSSKGCKDTAANRLSIYPKPSAAFATPDVCLGKISSFTNSSTGANTYRWQFGNGISSTSSSPTLTYKNAGTYDLQLIATSTFNCADTSDAQVEIFALPEPNFTATTACFGDSIGFTDQSSNTASRAWTLGDGQTSTFTSFKHLYAASGHYSIALVATSGDGCIDSIRKNTQVFSLPTPSFTATAACLGNASKFTNLSTTIGSQSFWRFESKATSLLDHPSHVFASAKSYAVTLIQTNANNCVDSISQTVVVDPLPQVSFSASEVCLNENTVFNNMSSIASGTLSTYDWNLGDGTTSTQKDPKHKYPKANTYFASLTATSDKGCSAEKTNAIKVNSLPIASFAAASICLLEPSIFSESISSEDAIDSIYWEFGDGLTHLGSTPSHLYKSAGLFNALLKVVTVNGCNDISNSTAEVYQKPSAAFSVADVCFVEKSLFTNLSADASSYEWDFGDGDGSSLKENPSYQYINPGTYQTQLIATNSHNCKDTTEVDAVIFENPIANFDIENVCLTDDVSPLETSIGDIASYLWTFDLNESSNDVAPTYSYDSAGSYDVWLHVVSDDGCTDSVARLITIYPKPILQVSPDSTISKGTKIWLSASGASNYSWSPSQSLNRANGDRVFARPLESTTYQVIGESDNGCTEEASIAISVSNDYYLTIANLFTPDGNGRNETWHIGNIDTYSDCEVFVFDKKGREVFQSSAYNNDWDGTMNGKPLPDDSYYYVIDCAGGERVYKGAVTILRNR